MTMTGRLVMFTATMFATSACGQIDQRHDVGEPVSVGRDAREEFADAELSALAEAACSGDIRQVHRIAARGLDLDGSGRREWTPLLWALSCESLDGTRALLEAGADPNRASFSGLTPVTAAARLSDPDFLRVVLQYGGDVNNIALGTNRTPLATAFATGVEGSGWSNYYLLLDAGADINVEHEGQTIAERAALLNHYDKVAELLDRGYTRNLNRLAFWVQRADLELVRESQVAWHGCVVSMLEQRGIVFPVSLSDAGLMGLEPLVNE